MTAETTERDRFEAWIAAPPYERTTRRYRQDGEMWDGQYVDLTVQVAWEAWQEARRIVVDNYSASR